ncbi:DUF4232 domain-containing protein [Kutzneria sp. CA-103260]|uniref:DUF4232 domain-containing protein n=1 Tax=Kutzneria sp. CA-103260 TaxID=2802641 RepID=UPI001BA724D0|nr:DUF4232 domain-containing protein [Kutzneria sp. CA-103260]QUQ66148.1 lipoprotein [Kutzneria sp. CA-103260]
MKKATVAMAIGVVAAGGLLGACGTATPSNTAAAGTSSTTHSATPVAKTSANAAGSSSGSSDSRCATGDLSVTLGAPKKHDDGSGQFEVPVVFKNTSSHSCDLYGVPDVSLLGPDDPNGSTYQLVTTDNGAPRNQVGPGETATASITVLEPSGDSVGSLGSKSWLPTKAKITPPTQSQSITVDWTPKIPVLRQDSATHPGSYVNGILADPS